MFCRKVSEEGKREEGVFDGAKVADLVGLLVLDKINQEIPEICFGLYRDDGIAHHKKMRPQA